MKKEFYPKMEKRKFNPTEKKIMRLLYQTQADLTIYEIAKEVGISYVTSKKYVKLLCADGILGEIKPLSNLNEDISTKTKKYTFVFGLFKD